MGQYPAAVRVMEALGFTQAKMTLQTKTTSNNNNKNKDKDNNENKTKSATTSQEQEKSAVSQQTATAEAVREFDDFYVMTDAYILRYAGNKKYPTTR